MIFRSIGVLFLGMAILGTTALGQPITYPDPYRTSSGRLRTQQEVEAIRRAARHQQEVESRIAQQYREWRGSGNPSSVKSAAAKFTSELLTPTKQERLTNRSILERSNGGIFSFLNLDQCASLSDVSRVIPVDEKRCLLSLPGFGQVFSFRRRGYVSVPHADLGAAREWFYNPGYGTQTILVDLGDVPLTTVDLKASDLQYIVEFAPALTLDGANKQRVELEEGVVRNGREFFHAVKAVPGHTYVLRSVAYRGEIVTVVNAGDKKIRIDRLKDDARSDIIVSFRLLERDARGDARILWRLLQTKESPKLEFPENEVMANQFTRTVTQIN